MTCALCVARDEAEGRQLNSNQEFAANIQNLRFSKLMSESCEGAGLDIFGNSMSEGIRRRARGTRVTHDIKSYVTIQHVCALM
jgi:hypothetical protein